MKSNNYQSSIDFKQMYYQENVYIPNSNQSLWKWLEFQNLKLWEDYDARSYRTGIIFPFKSKEIAIAFVLANS